MNDIPNFQVVSMDLSTTVHENGATSITHVATDTENDFHLLLVLRAVHKHSVRHNWKK